MVSPLALGWSGERLATVVAFGLVLVVYEQSFLPVQARVAVPKQVFRLSLESVRQPMLELQKSLMVHPMVEEQLLVLGDFPSQAAAVPPRL